MSVALDQYRVGSYAQCHQTLLGVLYCPEESIRGQNLCRVLNLLAAIESRCVLRYLEVSRSSENADEDVAAPDRAGQR
jgi:hypothetical protein